MKKRLIILIFAVMTITTGCAMNEPKPCSFNNFLGSDCGPKRPANNF